MASDEVWDSSGAGKPDQSKLNADNMMTTEEAKHLLSVMMRAKVLSNYFHFL